MTQMLLRAAITFGMHHSRCYYFVYVQGDTKEEEPHDYEAHRKEDGRS